MTQRIDPESDNALLRQRLAELEASIAIEKSGTDRALALLEQASAVTKALGIAQESSNAVMAELIESLAAADRWILRHDSGVYRVIDHACAKCVPDGPIVMQGFECAWHAATRRKGEG